MVGWTHSYWYSISAVVSVVSLFQSGAKKYLDLEISVSPSAVKSRWWVKHVSNPEEAGLDPILFVELF